MSMLTPSDATSHLDKSIVTAEAPPPWARSQVSCDWWAGTVSAVSDGHRLCQPLLTFPSCRGRPARAVVVSLEGMQSSIIQPGRGGGVTVYRLAHPFSSLLSQPPQKISPNPTDPVV